MATVKKIPDYQTIDGFKMASAFSPKAFRDTVNFKFQTNDLILATYPKCGTTWTQQIIYLLRHNAEPATNYHETMLDSPYLELVGTEGMDQIPEPRAFKVHLPYHLTPFSSDAKYVVVFRNPKDCLVSFYHHTRGFLFYDFVEGDFNDYFELFINEEVDYGDFFDHVLSWYAHKDKPNVHCIIYEEMKKDPKTAILKLAEFMGDEYRMLVEDQSKLEAVLEYSSFEYMKKTTNQDMGHAFNNVVTPDIDVDSLPISSALKYMFKYRQKKGIRSKEPLQHLRKGIVGDWRNNFTQDQNRRMNEKIEAKLAGTTLLAYWKSIDCL